MTTPVPSADVKSEQRTVDLAGGRRPQIAYAVSSAGDDFWAACARVSIASVRVTNPDVAIVLACDSRSRTALDKFQSALLGEVDEVLEVPTPDGPEMFRNRFVKTSLRDRLAGPFLLLDSDTLVRRRLDPVWSQPCDVAAALNHSADEFLEQFWDEDRQELNGMGWQISDRHYVNGGVLYLNDTPGAKRFGRLWHELWLSAQSVSGRHRDQPALNAALRESGAHLTILDHAYNAQIMKRPAAARDAAIWHYYNSGAAASTTAFGDLVRACAGGRPVDREQLWRAIRADFPWRNRGFADRRRAAAIASRDVIGPEDVQWYRGEYSALRALLPARVWGLLSRVSRSLRAG